MKTIEKNPIFGGLPQSFSSDPEFELFPPANFQGRDSEFHLGRLKVELKLCKKRGDFKSAVRTCMRTRALCESLSREAIFEPSRIWHPDLNSIRKMLADSAKLFIEIAETRKGTNEESQLKEFAQNEEMRIKALDGLGRHTSASEFFSHFLVEANESGCPIDPQFADQIRLQLEEDWNNS